jgi:hypothetical protein
MIRKYGPKLSRQLAWPVSIGLFVRPSVRTNLKGVSVKKVPAKMLLPVGIGLTTIILVGVVAGVVQMSADGRTGSGEPVAASSTSSSVSPGSSPQVIASGTPAVSASPDGPMTTIPEPAPPAQSAEPADPPAEEATSVAPPPGQGSQASSPAAAPPAAGPPAAVAPAPADAQTVQRVKDSCTSRLEGDAASSGLVAGPAVGRPFTLVSLEFLGVPQQSTAASGLASYDVRMRVTTQVVNSPAQTGDRVCRVYDYDSHVDWLPAG